jgi:succinate dehydrogenase/fumarate reductase-like Fe-S protein
MSETTLRVMRGVFGEAPTIESYTVPFEDGLTLLDALGWIREHVDPSLAVRFSCRANACKECSALIDGKPGFLCCERATDGGVVELRPLPRPRWIRDLVTELT